MLSAVPAPTAAVPVCGRPPYILLVDDHEPSLRLLHHVVRGAGHRCAIASSATAALRLFEAGRPQVVVTDLSMPNLDGRGLADWISARYPSLPMVLMTGEQLESEDLDDLRRTFTAVFSKPIDPDRFLDWIDRLMPSQSIHEPTLTSTPP